MADRPILFSGPMVRAILDGRKTQTRRILKPQPAAIVTGFGRYGASTSPGYWKDEWSWLSGDTTDLEPVVCEGNFKTGFLEGDRLWVRETWQQIEGRSGPLKGQCLYRADARDNSGYRWPDITPGDPFRESVWRPSIFMPRWASRITLIVEEIRVQRLQDISEADASAEGSGEIGSPLAYTSHRQAFEYIWDSLNAKRGYGWEKNPWVVAVTFRPVFKNIGEAVRQSTETRGES